MINPTQSIGVGVRFVLLPLKVLCIIHLLRPNVLSRGRGQLEVK